MSDTGDLDSVSSVPLEVLGQNNLKGFGDCMHVNVVGGIAYVGHQGYSPIGTSIVDVSERDSPRLITQLERPAGTHTHKVQVVGDILLVNHERNMFEAQPPTSWSAGLAIYDVSSPAQPRQIAFYGTPGTGVHRMTYWEPPYAFVSGTDEGFIGRFLHIVDLSDPADPNLVGRWWYPGQHTAGGETPAWEPGSGRFMDAGLEERALHHALPRGDRLYCGWWHGGLVILDIENPTEPEWVGHLDFDGSSVNTHTTLPVPGRDILVLTDELLTRNIGTHKEVRVVDISDETNPTVIATLPRPPDEGHHERGIRFGPHNLHEPRPGSLVDGETIYLTYFAGGLRVYDISDPRKPMEKAHLVPETPHRVPGSPSPAADAIVFNDVTVTEDGTIYVTDRHGGGLFIVSPLESSDSHRRPAGAQRTRPME